MGGGTEGGSGVSGRRGRKARREVKGKGWEVKGEVGEGGEWGWEENKSDCSTGLGLDRRRSSIFLVYHSYFSHTSTHPVSWLWYSFHCLWHKKVNIYNACIYVYTYTYVYTYKHVSLFFFELQHLFPRGDSVNISHGRAKREKLKNKNNILVRIFIFWFP